MRYAILIIPSIQCVYEVSGFLVILIRVPIRVQFDLFMNREKKGSLHVCMKVIAVSG